MDKDVCLLAKRWARDDPESWEDLAQEARLAIVEELRDNPDAPRTHLFRRAKHEVLDYRKRGKSVDGKLDKTYKREHVWGLVSMDGDTALALSGRYPRPRQANSVEDEAIAALSYAELRAKLSEPEDKYLCLKLQGYSGKEAGVLLGLTPYRERQIRSSIQAKATDVFSGNGYHPL